MECIISGSNLKTFQKALHCLAKIGDSLVIETASSKLIFRTLNASQAAFVRMTFFSGFGGFFEKYDFNFLLNSQSTQPSPGMEPSFKCKVRIRSCLAAIRSLSDIERLYMSLDQNLQCLTFLLLTKQGVKRTHRFPFEEQPSILQADFSRKACPSLLITAPKRLTNVLNHFHPQVEEITLLVSSDQIIVKTYLDENDRNIDKINYTEQKLSSSLFHSFLVRIAEDTQSQVVDLTFTLKEFKAMLLFCDVTKNDICIFFDEGGRPILLTNQSEDSSGDAGSEAHQEIHVDLILATMKPDHQDQAEFEHANNEMKQSQARDDNTTEYSGEHDVRTEVSFDVDSPPADADARHARAHAPADARAHAHDLERVDSSVVPTETEPDNTRRDRGFVGNRERDDRRSYRHEGLEDEYMLDRDERGQRSNARMVEGDNEPQIQDEEPREPEAQHGAEQNPNLSSRKQLEELDQPMEDVNRDQHLDQSQRRLDFGEYEQSGNQKEPQHRQQHSGGSDEQGTHPLEPVEPVEPVEQIDHTVEQTHIISEKGRQPNISLDTEKRKRAPPVRRGLSVISLDSDDDDYKFPNASQLSPHSSMLTQPQQISAPQSRATASRVGWGPTPRKKKPIVIDDDSLDSSSDSDEGNVVMGTPQSKEGNAKRAKYS